MSADVGFNAEDLGGLYASSADWVGALHTAYSILVGFSSERSACRTSRNSYCASR